MEKQAIKGPTYKKPEPVPEAETPVVEPQNEPTPEEQPEPVDNSEKPDAPVDEETFYALPPKQAYQAYMDMKSKFDALASEGDQNMEAAVAALRTELEGKHATDMAGIKEAIKEAIYGV